MQFVGIWLYSGMLESVRTFTICVVFVRAFIQFIWYSSILCCYISYNVWYLLRARFRKQWIFHIYGMYVCVVGWFADCCCCVLGGVPPFCSNTVNLFFVLGFYLNIFFFDIVLHSFCSFSCWCRISLPHSMYVWISSSLTCNDCFPLIFARYF